MLPANPGKRVLYRFTTSLLASISAILLSIYQATLEFEIEGEDHLRLLEARERNYIVAVWHTFVDAAVFCLHSRSLCIYSDHPRTVEYEKSWQHYLREIGLKTIRALGFDVIDASLGKQSAGVLNFVRKVQGGTPALVAPDGPHGPIYEAKPGVIYMARKSGSAIVPMGVGFSHHVVGPNWDDFHFPLPFSRVAVVYGEPILLSPGAMTDEEMTEYTRKMEATLDDLCHRANEILTEEPNGGAQEKARA